ncbi:28S ribosomal protein S27 [Dirofilaria immitis]
MHPINNLYSILVYPVLCEEAISLCVRSNASLETKLSKASKFDLFSNDIKLSVLSNYCSKRDIKKYNVNLLAEGRFMSIRSSYKSICRDRKKVAVLLMHRSTRCLLAARRHLLSKKFALSEEWYMRHRALSELGIEGGYEWITAVQKKFVSAGIASAVDVDAAVCIAEELDQLDDVLKIVYRLRHIEMTSRMLPSTEYALIRLLLKHHKTDILLAILADPINYGIFLNEHSACLVIDNFLEANKITDAARIASCVMLQEMFQSALLNWLCIYSSLRWTELPAEQRIFEKLPSLDYISGMENDSGNMEDEDEMTFKFPYLKNEYNDMHFDLIDPNQLIGKCLLWFSNYVPLNEKEASNIRFVGSIFFGNYILAKQLLQTTNIMSSAAAICRSKLVQVKADNSEQLQDKQLSGNTMEGLQEILDRVEDMNTNEKLSDMIVKYLKDVQNTEEENLVEIQRNAFLNWRENRANLIKAQVEQLDLKLRLKETYEERRKLHHRWEMLNFFENRLKWEDMAAVKEDLLKVEQGKRKSKEDLEQEYVDEVFHKKNVAKF